MTLIIIGFIIFVYIVGIRIHVNYMTTRIRSGICHDREVVPRDMRISLLWPVLSIFWLLKLIILMFFNSLNLFLVLFGYTKYKNSGFYKFVNEKLE